ncbi:MAG: hypothetical protein ACAH83_03960 [Alphaproteobacteria bacterium]
MARELKELEDFLWEEFDAAKRRHLSFVACDDTSYSKQGQPANFATDNRKTMAELAQAIVAVRREMRVEKFTEDQQKIEEEIANGTRRDVLISRPLKIKP